MSHCRVTAFDAMHSKMTVVLFRYVGVNYSNALEAMEDAMLAVYNQSSNLSPISNPVVGQLVAVRGQGEDEVTRAQVMEIRTPDNIKVGI